MKIKLNNTIKYRFITEIIIQRGYNLGKKEFIINNKIDTRIKVIKYYKSFIKGINLIKNENKNTKKIK